MDADTTAGPDPDAPEDCCSTATLDLPSEAVEADVRVLSALANETRYGIVRVLANADGAVCACDLAAPLGVSQSAVSHALSALYAAGLVDRHKDGRWRYYRTTPRAAAFLDALDADRGDTDD